MGLRSAALLATWIVSLASVASAQEISEQRVRAAVDDAARGLGQSVAGGSPMTAPAGTTGGLGHFLASLGIGVTRIDIEDPQRESGTVEFLLPTAGARIAVGLTSGMASERADRWRGLDRPPRTRGHPDRARRDRGRRRSSTGSACGSRSSARRP